LRNLDGGFVRDRGDDLWDVVLDADSAGLTGLNGLPLQVNVLAVGLGSLHLLGIRLDAVNELLTAGRVLDVLDAEVDTLLEVAVANHLVDDNTDSGLGDVVDNTSLSVVDLMGHTLLDGTVTLDIDDITDAELSKVGGHADHALLPELARERIAGTRPKTSGVTHCCCLLVLLWVGK